MNTSMYRLRGSAAFQMVMTLLATFGVAEMAWADLGPLRYASIVGRNPFDLKPPQDLASLVRSVPPSPPVQLAAVELTGLISVLASKRAILEIIPGPGKPMLKPILAEGEKIESVEVVSIDIDKSEVIIKNGSLMTNLTFKVARTPGPTLASAQPPRGPAIPTRVGLGATPGVPSDISYQSSPTSPGRSAVIMTGGPIADNTAPATSDNGIRSIPPRTIRSGNSPQAPSPSQPISAEAGVINLEHNRQNNPAYFPPLPPSPLTQ